MVRTACATPSMTATSGDTPGPPKVPGDALRRRQQRILAALLGVVVLGAGLAGLQRSVTRPLLSTVDGPSSFPGEPVRDHPASGAEIRVAYQHGAPYEFAFTMTNSSRWPVQILGFPAFGDVLRQRSVTIDWTPLAGDGSRPFRPFTLGADDSVLVRVRSEFAHCDRYASGASATVDRVPVRYRALWATRTRFLHLPAAIDVPAPRGSCPVT